MYFKIYLGHSIATTGEAKDSIRVANNIRDILNDKELGNMGEVYVASENMAINDKTNDPTPADIYQGDITRLMGADIVIYDLNGNRQDGTISEIGFTAGYGEGLRKAGKELNQLVVGYTSNSRVISPDFAYGVPSASACHLPLGMIEEWGAFVGTEERMYKALEILKEVVKANKELSQEDVFKIANKRINDEITSPDGNYK